jgi:uncharacterized protein with FMN-binding domain
VKAKQYTVPALLTTAALAIPLGTILATTHPSSSNSTTAAKATPTPKSKSKTSSKHTSRHTSTKTYKYTGPSEDMQWGPVQVTIYVKGKKITDLQATAPMERARSAFINQQAIPMLRQEVLQVQSDKIDAISGATMTSVAFYYSLVQALKDARLA